MTARRKAPQPFERGTNTRPAIAAERTASRLPTIAALMSALAIVTSTGDATAIVRAAGQDAGVEDSSDDAGTDAAPDAAYCDPRDVPLGGVQMPTRVHGTGCGCGASGDDDDSTTAALLTTAALGIALSRRRRGPIPFG